MIKLYTLDNQFIKETDTTPKNFTGIIEYEDGTKVWWVEGKLHRIVEAEVEYISDNGQYWINNKRYTETEHKLFVDLLKLKK